MDGKQHNVWYYSAGSVCPKDYGNASSCWAMAQVLLNIRLNNMLIKLFLYLTSPAQQHDPKSAFQCQHTQHIFWKNLGIARIC
jgi:hypothetical protein